MWKTEVNVTQEGAAREERVNVWLAESLAVEVEKEIWWGSVWGQAAEAVLHATLGSLKHVETVWVTMGMYDWNQEVKLQGKCPVHRLCYRMFCLWWCWWGTRHREKIPRKIFRDTTDVGFAERRWSCDCIRKKVIGFAGRRRSCDLYQE